MPSKYGGIPINEERTGSKYGGVPVDEAPLPGTEKTGIPGIPKPPVPEGMRDTPSTRGLANAPIFTGPASSQMARSIPQIANGDWKGGASNLIEGAGAALSPLAIPGAIAAPVAAATAAAGGYAGQKAGEGITRAFGGSPDTQRLVGDVAAIPGGMAGGKAGGVLSKIAAPLAESALGIRGAAREYGATPGKAIIEETTGVRPAQVASSAQGRMDDLTAELENRAKNTKTQIDLQPARQVAGNAIASARAGNSIPSELMPIQEHLTIPHKGFAGAMTQPPAPAVNSPIAGPNGALVDQYGSPLSIPKPGQAPPPMIAPKQAPIDYLSMKRRLGTDFTNFRPGQSTPESVDVANQVYGQMARDFNTAVPGGEQLNQRIQSLIPVAQRAHVVDLNAGPMDRMLDRATRPTGGMVGPLAAFHAGGIPGAAAAITGQELLASPVAKLAAARTANAIGKPLPALQGALVGAKKRGDQ